MGVVVLAVLSLDMVAVQHDLMWPVAGGWAMARIRGRGARRIASGSRITAWRIGCGAASWVRRGPATAHRVRRSAGLVLLTAVSCGIVTAHHGLMWPLVAGWAVAAWRAGHADQPEPEQPAETPEAGPDEHRQVFLSWLEEVTRDRNGIHLAELYTRLRELPGLAHHQDAELRQVLDHYGIRVRRTIRVDGIAGRSGIHRSDITSLLSPPPESAPLSGGGDTGQSPTLRVLSASGEEVESP